MNLSAIIDELVEERGLDRSVLGEIVCEGMLGAYQKRYPELALSVELDKRSHDVSVWIEKEVVSQVSDDDTQISVRKARAVVSGATAGQVVKVPFGGPIGRIEILRAKQIIASQIRNIEASAVYDEFKEKEGCVVHGVVHKNERMGTAIKLQDTPAFLPRSLSIPGETLVPGHHVKALLKEVLAEPRNENQLILDRSSADLVRHLFEVEVPEVFEKLVEIKKVVRAPGYKTKIAVISHDKNIDPVGTCVGVGGARIKPILKELGSEKVDVIEWNDSLEQLVKQALKPADIDRVEVFEDKGAAHVWLDEDQRSLAIGRMGKNITLAGQLVDLDIHLVQGQQKDGDEVVIEGLE